MDEWKKITNVHVKHKMEFVLTHETDARALGLPRQPVACGMDGPVGVESTGVCGPVRAEAGGRCTAHAARGLNAANLTMVVTPAHLLGNQKAPNNVTCWNTHTPAFVPFCDRTPSVVCENIPRVRNTW